MGSIELITQVRSAVDEIFKAESKRSLLTNHDYDWTGAHTIKIYKISTSKMNDYLRNGVLPENQWSRYGVVQSLDAVTEELMLKKDRSFTFEIDKLDTDETAKTLEAATALARQLREVAIPEIDTYVYGVMNTGAGHKPSAIELNENNIYSEIVKASSALDDSEIPETDRVLLVTPHTYELMKMSSKIVLNTDVGADMRIRGVIANLDGAAVVKVPAVRLPKKFGFMMSHKSACVAPVKLEDYTIHDNPPGISGSLVEGRIVYDGFVLDNKTKGIYYQAIA